MSLYISLQLKKIGGIACYISQRFRAYSFDGNKAKSNLKYLRESLRKYGLSNTPHGVYIIYKGSSIYYIGHSQGEINSSNVLKAMQRHFHRYNDKNRQRRVEIEKDNYRIQFIFPQTNESNFSYKLEKTLIAFYKPKENELQYIKEGNEYSEGQLKKFIEGLNVDFSKDLIKNIKALKKNNRTIYDLKDSEEINKDEYEEYRKIFEKSNELPSFSQLEEIEDIPF